MTGVNLDIRPISRFQWYVPVYYEQTNGNFPSDTREKKGYFFGIAENIGHVMTYKILTDNTHKIICCSNIRSVLNPSTSKLRLDLSDGENKDSTPPLSNERLILPDLDPDTCIKIIKFANNFRQDKIMVFISPENMIGRLSLSRLTENDTIANGERHRDFIVKKLKTMIQNG